MKIGILTFHDSLNHGAYLQAYGSVQSLRALGHEPVIINYKNKEHWLRENVRPWLAYRRPVRFLDHLNKQRTFSNDLKQFPSSVYTRDPEIVRQMRFDAVIVGSDVVWDTNIFGFDSLYFGDMPTGRMIAFAASCGSLDIEAEIAPEIVNGIKRFSMISVRDVNTETLVEQITGHKPIRVLDPVFLTETLAPSAHEACPFDEPFVLVYGNSIQGEESLFVREFASRRGLKILSVGCRNLWADRSLLSVGPLSIMSYFKKAAFVFSSTFHGAIFSVCCQKNFVVRLHPLIHNKVTSLLQILRLPERAATQLKELAEVVESPIEFQRINALLDVEKERRPLRSWTRHSNR